MKQPSTGKVILKTALITTAALLLACVIIAVIVLLCFPYEGYKFTSELGMKKSALFFAERYEESGNIDGLVYCIELEDELLASDKNYADKLIAHTQKFFEYENVNDYFAQLDEYYVSNSKPQYRVGLYSYYDYVVSRNYKARAAAGKDNQMIFRSEPTDLDDLFPKDITMEEKAVIYSALCEQLRLGKSSFLNGQSFTPFYYQVQQSVVTYIVGLEAETDTLKTLYLMRGVIYLINEVIDFFEDNQLAADKTEWQGFFDNYKYNYNGSDLSLSKAYAQLLSDYIKQEGEKAQ